MKINIKTVFLLSILIILALLLRILFEVMFDFYSTKYSFTQFVNIFLHFLLNAIAVLIWLGIVVRVETTPSKLPWLLLLLFEPFIGMTLFLTFGSSFKTSKRYLSHPLIIDGKYLTKEPITDFEDLKYKQIDSDITDIYKTAYNMTKHHAYLDDSKVTVLKNGEKYFPRLIEVLSNAENFILMEFYIVRADNIGKKVLNILEQKAKDGVEVKLIYDAIGSLFLNRRFMKRLSRSGVQIVVNDKVNFEFFNTRLFHRNHRKVTVVDGMIGFIGGMNLGDEYNNASRKYGKFRDTHLELEGKVVNSLTALYFRDWYYSCNEFIEDEKYFKAVAVKSKGLVQIIPSGPDFNYPPIRNTYVKMINNAKKSIKIMTPYLALDQEMMTSLIIAAKGDVDVSMILPGKPDYRSVFFVTKSFFEQLLSAGVKIYLCEKTFTHAKIFIVDDMIASCGSYNLDNRSARINFEVTALLFNEAVDELVSDFAIDKENSKEILLSKWKKRGNINRLLEGLFNLFSPIV